MSTPDFLKKLLKPIEDLNNNITDFASKRDNNELEDYYSECAKSMGITKEEFKEWIRKQQEGEEKELSKVKDNSGSPVENFLNSDEILSQLSFKIACWARVIEITELKNEIIPPKDLVRFCRLFLEHQKKIKNIKDYNRADVRVMKMLVLSISISDVEEAIRENDITYPSMKKYEGMIGY